MSGLTLNEMMEDEEVFWDQPCIFGRRYGCHAVYCKNSHKNSPMKCRNSWFFKQENLDSKCQFFKSNPNYKPIGGEMKGEICPKCHCEIKEQLDSESCWCGVKVSITPKGKKEEI